MSPWVKSLLYKHKDWIQIPEPMGKPGVVEVCNTHLKDRDRFIPAGSHTGKPSTMLSSDSVRDGVPKSKMGLIEENTQE